MTPAFFRRTLTAAAATGSSAALILAAATGASAHVGITPDKTSANSNALLSFGIPHGCGKSATTRVAITLPAELNDAQPTVNPNWAVEKVTEQLAKPRKLADGTSITKRTSQVVYTAKTPLDHELRDVLVLSVRLPDAAGSTLYFPTLQTCEAGRTDWTEIATDGQDPHSLKTPAPSITVTESAGTDGHAAPPGTAPAGTAVHTTEQDAAADSGSTALSWAGLAAGLGGLVLGGVALARGGSVRRHGPGN